jgi:cytochrome c oxidase subunit 2
VVHTWSVPDLAPKRDAVPGETSTIAFRADEEGTYGGQSATLSGDAYAAMRTEVDVVSPERYEEFVKTQKQDIQTAQDTVVGLIEGGETP